MRYILSIATALLVAELAVAQNAMQQFPGTQYGQGGPAFNPNNFMPNIFNPQYQPVSPYMNLLRGGNVAANYFYGVRPGTVGMGPRGFGGAPFVASGGNRMIFFPQLASAPDPLMAGMADQPPSVLPPAGHPVVYGNTMGFFPSPYGQAGGARPGLSGLGSMSGRRR